MCALYYPLRGKGEWELIQFPEPKAKKGIGGLSAQKSYLGYKIVAIYRLYPDRKIVSRVIRFDDSIVYRFDKILEKEDSFDKGADAFLTQLSSLENIVENELPSIALN